MRSLKPVVALVVFLTAVPTGICVAAHQSEHELAPYIALLNEISERRRPNTFFVNEQSPTRGVQVDYVNVGAGNLTFLRRDLTTVGRIPIVAGRVYDSSAGDTGDFGPGWRLATAETIAGAGDDQWVYTDESGSPQVLSRYRGRVEIENAALSDVESARMQGGAWELIIRSGWTKRFELIDGVYRMTQVTDRNGNALSFEFVNGRLAGIEGQNGRFVAITRNFSGRIESLTDDQGREVRFGYTDGRLSSAQDLGGNTWSYQYDTAGRLNQVTDPLDQRALEATYAADGKARFAMIRGARNDFDYQATTTIVTDGRGLTAEYSQNEIGITIRVLNADGVETEITLGDDLLAREVKLNGRQRSVFAYGAEGFLDRFQSFQDQGVVERWYDFDWDHRRVGRLTGSDGLDYQMVYDGHGNLRQKRSNGVTTTYRYTTEGDLSEVREGGELVRAFEYNVDGQVRSLTDTRTEATFDHDPVGRLTRVTFSDGAVYSYEYTAQGLRERANLGDRTSIYGYDAAGRLTTVRNIESGGTTSGHDYVLDAANRTTEIGILDGPTIQISYDGNGNPIRYGDSNSVHTYQYDQVNRFVGVNPSVGEPLVEEYEADEAGWRGRMDTRTMVNLAPEQTASAVYGSGGEVFLGRSRGLGLSAVRYDGSSQTLQAVGNLGIVPPEAAMLATLNRIRLDLLSGPASERLASFNRPSNSFFLPPEYASINCSVGCNAFLVSVSISNNPTVGQPVSMTAVGLTDDFCQATASWDFGDGGSGLSYGQISNISHIYSWADTFEAETVLACNCVGIIAFSAVSVTVLKVTVLTANVSGDEIKVKLEPASSTGVLKVEVTGASNHTIYNQSVSGGTKTITYDVANLPDGKEYTKVKATWTVGSNSDSDEKNSHFKVLGDIQQTQYNSPKQSDATCQTGATSSVFITKDSAPEVTNCWAATPGWSTNTFHSKLVSEIAENGSGRLSSGQTIQVDGYCPGFTNPPSAPRPPGVTSSNTYRQRTAGAIPQCGTGFALNGNTVAIDFAPGSSGLGSELSCGDTIYIDGIGAKTVTDQCPGCGASKIDNYNASYLKCTGLGGLGTKKTLKVY